MLEDFPCLWVALSFFLFLLCFTLLQDQFVGTDTRQQEVCLTPTPSKLAKTELLLSVISISISLQKSWRSLGEGMKQTERSTAHLLASHTYN